MAEVMLASALSALLEHFPYLVALCALFESMSVKSRGLKGLIPGWNTFFWKILGCMALSTVLKQLVHAERPGAGKGAGALRGVPRGWHAEDAFDASRRVSVTIITVDKKYQELFRSIPVRELGWVPASARQVKDRYVSRSGMPSAHSVVSGCLIAYFGNTSWPNIALKTFAGAVALSRIFLGHHYPCQVAAGLLAGLAYGRLAR